MKRSEMSTISELGLSVRTANALTIFARYKVYNSDPKRFGWSDPSDLYNEVEKMPIGKLLHGVSKRELLKTKNFGRKSLVELNEVLEDIGMKAFTDSGPPVEWDRWEMEERIARYQHEILANKRRIKRLRSLIEQKTLQPKKIV